MPRKYIYGSCPHCGVEIDPVWYSGHVSLSETDTKEDKIRKILCEHFRHSPQCLLALVKCYEPEKDETKEPLSFFERVSDLRVAEALVGKDPFKKK